MIVEIGTEAAQFPKMEYMNEIFVAVWGSQRFSDTVGELIRIFLTPPIVCRS